MPNDERDGRPDGSVAVARRAPFSDNPRVGVRGLRTQQRILDAALQAFAEGGFHGCSVDRIATLARCSRVSLYQYFAGKDDVFRQLAGQVARQVSASTEALDPLTHDADGWAALRAWVARYAEIHARYEPVFHAVESDDELAAVAWRTGEETVARIHARLTTTALPARQLDSVITLFLECLNHTLDISGILRTVVPDAYSREQVEVAFTDVMHRTLFGVHGDVNVHAPTGPSSPPLEPRGEMLDMLRRDGVIAPEAPAYPALDALLSSGRDVFVERGYHNTRIEDLVAAAGVSRGAFYRYFRSKDQLARTLTARAVRSARTAVEEMPDVTAMDRAAGKAVMRRWLRRYHSAHTNEAAMLRVWVDAAHQDPALRAESAPLLDWGRRRMARYLQPRGFGDLDTEAVVMVALLGVLGARPRSAAAVDAAALIIERGLLGRTEIESEQK
jgi:AcrR family transcriptional regulator